MATLHIDKGTNVDAGWVGKIAVSADAGVSWTTINNSVVDRIGPVRILNAVNESNPGGHPVSERVHIHMNDGSQFDFDIKEVANQAAWNVGGVAALNTAVDDLSTWTS